MLRRRASWLALVGIVVLCSACVSSNGADSTAAAPTTETPSTTSTTEAPPTTGGDGTTIGTPLTTTTTEASQASFLDASGERPPGAEDQLNYTPQYMRICIGTLNGPESPSGIFEISNSTFTRLLLGDLLWRDLIAAAEDDPDLADRFEDLVPEITILPRAATVPPLTLTTTTTTITTPSTGFTFPSTGDLFLDPSELEPLATTPTITVPPDLPAITVPPEETLLAVGQTDMAIFCGMGWASEAAIQVTITGPTGVVHNETASARSGGQVDVLWRPGLDDPIGEYTIEVGDGTFTASDTFEVIEPSRPTIDFLFGSVEPGGALVLGLASFPADSQIDLHIYRNGDWEEPSMPFPFWVGTVPAVPIDSNGRAIVELQTLDTDPPGTYCVLPAIEIPRPCADASFEVVDQG